MHGVVSKGEKWTGQYNSWNDLIILNNMLKFIFITLQVQNKQKSDIVVGSWLQFWLGQDKLYYFTLWLSTIKKGFTTLFFLYILLEVWVLWLGKQKQKQLSRKPETKVKEGEWLKVLFFSKRNAFLVVFNSINFFLSVWLPVQLVEDGWSVGKQNT